MPNILSDKRSLAECRPRRVDRQLPVQYWDDVAAALPSLPPPPEEPTKPLPSSPLVPASAPSIAPLARSLRNIFGLSRQYCAPKFPSHDPEDHIDLQSLLEDDVVATTDLSQPNPTANPFFPYPNRNSFLLGDWYWNNSVLKTYENF